MTTIVQAIASPRRAGRSGATVRSRPAFAAAAVLGGSLVVAGLAQIAVPLPFTPVPITGQTLGVLLVGAALGPQLGAGALLAYLAEGAVGLPFFAQHAHGLSLLAPTSATGGYLWGFVVASAVVGLLARRGWDRSPRSALGAMFVGEIVLYAIAVPWLAHALGVSALRAMALGLYPFVVGDVLKTLIAAGLLPAAWRLSGRG